MSDFKLNGEKLPIICSQLGITDSANVALVGDLCRDYLYFYDNYVRTQHLAPIVMALERYIQKTYGKKGFKIVIKSACRDSNSKIGVAFLRWDECRYEVVVPHSIDAIATRNIVAHELGHLFYVMNCLHGDGTSNLVKNSYLACKMADVLGIFTILERTEFYMEKAPTVCRGNWQDVIHDFKKIGVGRRYPKNPLQGTAC
ncbi:MAG: hypothetical protein LBC70_09575 [Chitinispirillales bacterium]|jgi:hypothetical protein|nr:hypothetical protein [Chitinispirillales bacterium]